MYIQINIYIFYDVRNTHTSNWTHNTNAVAIIEYRNGFVWLHDNQRYIATYLSPSTYTNIRKKGNKKQWLSALNCEHVAVMCHCRVRSIFFFLTSFVGVFVFTILIHTQNIQLLIFHIHTHIKFVQVKWLGFIKFDYDLIINGFTFLC